MGIFLSSSESQHSWKCLQLQKAEDGLEAPRNCLPGHGKCWRLRWSAGSWMQIPPHDQDSTPAHNLRESQNCSDRGACGFVLAGDPGGIVNRVKIRTLPIMSFAAI